MMAAFWVAMAEIYGWSGLAVAAAFVLFGLDRVDGSAHGAYAFRLLLVPGLVLLWPVALLRWAQLERRRRSGGS